MDLFLLIYGVIVLIVLSTVIGVSFAVASGVDWYRRYRHARLTHAAPKSNVHDLLTRP